MPRSDSVELKEGIFVSVGMGLSFACTVASDGAILPSSFDRKLWSTDGAMFIRQKNVSAQRITCLVLLCI
jgi:hypothetical protein